MDERTPIIVGVGEVSERIGEAGYSAASPAELAGRAARAAVADAGADDIGAHIDLIAGIRQFETSRATAVAPFGRADNFPRAVGERIGADPARAILEITGGQGPQKLVNELAHAIAEGRSEMALIAGAEAISTMRDLLARGEKPDWSEAVGGTIEDRGYGIDGLTGEAMDRQGVMRPLPHYALFENARRAQRELGRDAYRLEMGELFAPFTQVAAANPHAMSREVRSAQELATITPSNRLTCDPYPRRVVSRDQANQGAAVLLTSIGKARALGIPSDRWVFLIGGADAKERPITERPDLAVSPAAIAAFRAAHQAAGVGIGEVEIHDLYSCFPIAVFNIQDAFRLRGSLTVTGGLPFFGGAGNNYSTHAIASMVRTLRERPKAVGVVGANGGRMSKYSVGVYTAQPTPWRPFDSTALPAKLDAAPTAPQADSGDGDVETYTIDYAETQPRALVVGRTDAGARFVAGSTDAAIVQQMIDNDPLKARVKTRTDEGGRNLIVGLEEEREHGRTDQRRTAHGPGGGEPAGRQGRRRAAISGRRRRRRGRPGAAQRYRLL
jgi:acetyl-CoA C-acetyltransferase